MSLARSRISESSSTTRIFFPMTALSPRAARAEAARASGAARWEDPGTGLRRREPPDRSRRLPTGARLHLWRAVQEHGDPRGRRVGLELAANLDSAGRASIHARHDEVGRLRDRRVEHRQAVSRQDEREPAPANERFIQLLDESGVVE